MCPLCYVPSMIKGKAKAQQVVEQSPHVDAQSFILDPDFRRGGSQNIVFDTPNFDPSPYQEDGEDQPEVPEVHQLQDFHKILHTGLASYRELEKQGFDWDLRYRGKIYELHCVPFTMLLKGDSVEQNKNNCLYGPSSKGIQNPCWECTWPMAHADEPYLMRKTPVLSNAKLRLSSKLW